MIGCLHRHGPRLYRHNPRLHRHGLRLHRHGPRLYRHGPACPGHRRQHAIAIVGQNKPNHNREGTVRSLSQDITP
jgi:hypothetical protein